MRTGYQTEDINIQLNTRLIERQGLIQSEVDDLLRLHIIKHKIFTKMEKLDPEKENTTLRFLAQTVRQIEFAQQKVWKFTKDENHHRWFEVPHCQCPQMDNAERLGTPYQIVNGNCPVHGNSHTTAVVNQETKEELTHE